MLWHVRSLNQGPYTNDHNYVSYFIFSSASFLALLISFFISYACVDRYTSVPVEWLLQLAEKCPDIHENDTFIRKSLVDFGVCFILISSYYGILLDSKYGHGTPSEINDTDLKTSALRLIATLVISLPCLLPYFLIHDTAPLGVLFVFKTSVPFTCYGFLLFAVNKVVLQRLKLTNEENAYSSVVKEKKRSASVDTVGDERASMAFRRIDHS